MKNLGFTLIELLVVITILLLLTGGAIVGFQNFRDRQSAKELAKQANNLFVVAQQKASVKQSPTACIGTPSNAIVLQGYRVEYDDTTQTFELSAICATPPSGNALGIPTSFTPYPIEGQLVVVPSTIDVTSEQDEFNFYTLERGTNATTVRNYKFKIGTTEYTFSVSPSGTVSNVQ